MAQMSSHGLQDLLKHCASFTHIQVMFNFARGSHLLTLTGALKHCGRASGGGDPDGGGGDLHRRRRRAAAVFSTSRSLVRSLFVRSLRSVVEQTAGAAEEDRVQARSTKRRECMSDRPTSDCYAGEKVHTETAEEEREKELFLDDDLKSEWKQRCSIPFSLPADKRQCSCLC